MTGALIGSVWFGADEIVAAFVSSQIEDCQGFGPCHALGIVRDGKIVGGVVYHENRGYDVRVSIALTDGAGFVPWRTLFEFPFNKLKCARLTSLIAKNNTRSRKLCEALGFRREGAHPRAIDGLYTAISYGMLRENCRWIRKK